MITTTESTPGEIQSRPPRSFRPVVAAWLLALAATVLGISLNAAAAPMPGSEPLATEDVVDAVGGVLLGGLGVLLMQRRRAQGLGVGLVASAVVHGLVWLTGGAADALAGGRPSPSALARGLDVVSGGLFVIGFALIVLCPLLLFPTGHLPSRRWRPVGWLAVVATSASLLAILLRPGPVDDDVPAWGSNPLGVPALGTVLDGIQLAGLIGLAVCLVLAVVIVVVRLVRYRGRARRRMVWFAALISPVVAALPLDTDAVLPGALSAAVVFGLMITAIGYPLLGIGEDLESGDPRQRQHTLKQRRHSNSHSRRQAAPGSR